MQNALIDLEFYILTEFGNRDKIKRYYICVVPFENGRLAIIEFF